MCVRQMVRNRLAAWTPSSDHDFPKTSSVLFTRSELRKLSEARIAFLRFIFEDVEQSALQAVFLIFYDEDLE